MPVIGNFSGNVTDGILLAPSNNQRRMLYVMGTFPLHNALLIGDSLASGFVVKVIKDAQLDLSLYDLGTALCGKVSGYGGTTPNSMNVSDVYAAEGYPT